MKNGFVEYKNLGIADPQNDQLATFCNDLKHKTLLTSLKN